MSIKLKDDFHKLIDKVQDEELLKMVYKILLEKTESAPGEVWNSLTKAQQEDLILSDEESNYESKCISEEEFRKNLKKWL